MPTPAHDNLPRDSGVTALLARARDGDASALDALLPRVYDELRAIAHGQRFRHGAAETLNTTALVHEAYERLVRADAAWEGRAHFFRLAARVMRTVLVDYARAQTAEKRGGARLDVPLDAELLAADAPPDDVLALDEALTRLGRLDPRQGEVVELRYFVGLTIAETAEVLDLSAMTVKREWTMARAWLQREMSRAA